MNDFIVIPGRMVSLNEYINACRANKFKGASMKKKQELMVMNALIEADRRHTIHQHTRPCELWITFIEESRRRDLDNITIATKFIQDTMVRFGIFPDDSTKYINLLHYTVVYDDKFPRIEVIIREK